MKTQEYHLLSFVPLIGWIQLEFHLLHSQQKIVNILIMIFLSLLFCLSASINKDIISNVADAFQSCERFLFSRLILLGAACDSIRQSKLPVPEKKGVWNVVVEVNSRSGSMLVKPDIASHQQDVLEAENCMLGDSYLVNGV